MLSSVVEAIQKPIYAWKPRAIVPVKAQIVGEYLEKLRLERGGALVPNDLVRVAKSKRSPLHPCFEWDDTVAAGKHRDAQARYLMRNIVVVVSREDGERVDFRMLTVEYDEERGSGAYTSTIEILSNQERRRHLLQKALKEFEIWRDRYEHIHELTTIFQAMDELGLDLD